MNRYLLNFIVNSYYSTFTSSTRVKYTVKYIRNRPVRTVEREGKV